MPAPAIARLLVANRGEIAVRVVRACRDLGIASVAVYAGDDAESLHVRLADEAFRIEAGPGVRSPYLDADVLLRVAARAGADAVHPGYGFLSEDAAFAAAVEDAGLTWIGPPPAAVAALGDKARARELAVRVGAPMAGGTGVVAGPDDVREAGRRWGYPLVVKAVHGGGGRGMRVVRSPDDAEAAWQSATAEARAAFGDGACLVERFLERARHVETQCLADAHGAVAVVGTRDCSLQRRHQKLLEEAPAPGLGPDVERRLAEASTALLAAAGYRGAATCEFLLGDDGTVAFCEVNTRIQVEHPVTEEVAGLDLVVAQLRLAAGEPLADVLDGSGPPRGHAIEFRIVAEDPGRGFAPSPGTVTAWRMPAGPGVRVDGWVEAGTAVTGRYDALLAKIVVSGPTRAQALARARRALAEAHVAGVATTLPFHRALLDHPDVVADPPLVHTRWVEQGHVPLAPAQPRPGPSSADPAAATADLTVEVDGRRLEVRVPAWLLAGRAEARPDAAERPTDAGGTEPGSRDGVREGEVVVRADLPATVVRVDVSPGRRVDAGAPLVVLEAMKMEQPVTAPVAGEVIAVDIGVGDAVSTDQPLVTLRTATA